MTKPTLCFIGAGNMASSLIGGLIHDHYPPQQIIACDIDPVKLEALNHEFQIRTDTDSLNAVEQADVVILAVKPQIMQAVCTTLHAVEHRPLYLSIAAGVREIDINRWLGSDHAVVRCMPNTPALVGLGASALYANDAVSDLQKQLAEEILRSAGITVWVRQESELDAVTAISGSGPAYFFLFIEALQEAAIELGLSAENAARLARQTALGAATMALDKDVVALRAQVTSPGGTTERAIASFEQNQLRQIVKEATQAACQRSQELAQALSK